MYELNDLLLLLQSSQPIISIETHEEQRALDLIKRCQIKLNKRIVHWSITRGLVDSSTGRPTLELTDKAVTENVQTSADPKQALINISNSKTPSVYVLLDFHPYLDELNKEIDNTPELDQELRSAFTSLHAGIDDALDPETDTAVGSMLDDAIALEARFAATHPTAEKIVRELINSLSRIGI